MENLEYKITESALQALFQGKKVVFSYHGRPTVTLYPPNYGVFMTYEKLYEIETAAQMRAWEKLLELLPNKGGEFTQRG